LPWLNIISSRIFSCTTIRINGPSLREPSEANVNNGKKNKTKAGVINAEA